MSKLSYLGERSEPREQVSSEAVRGRRKELSFLSPAPRVRVSSCVPLGRLLFTIGNLRTMTKFTTTMSVDLERTGTRASVSAGKRKLKMQSIGRSTTTTLNVNKHVEVVQL